MRPESSASNRAAPSPVEPALLAGHLLDCGCLTCADRRAESRRLGYTPMPARDWRGEPLP